MEKYINLSLIEFSNDVAAKKTMPGGGSVAAYCVSLSTALASMVGNFTIGKKKYIQYDEDIKRIIKDAKKYEKEALILVDEDVEVFLPLAAAYKLPDSTEDEKKEKNKVMQSCMKNAATVPLKILKLCDNILRLHEELLDKGSKMLISDVGVGVMVLKSAVLSAKLNILINVKYIEDSEFVESYTKEMKKIEENICEKCDKIYEAVVNQLM